MCMMKDNRSAEVKGSIEYRSVIIKRFTSVGYSRGLEVRGQK